MTGTPIERPSSRAFDLWRDYGAQPATVLDGDVSTTNADATVTSASAAFTSADIGKTIAIPIGYNGSGGIIVSTIASVNSATSIEMADNATATLSGRTAIYGLDCAALIEQAIEDAVDAGGGVIQFPDGVLLVTRTIQDTGASGYNAQISVPHIPLPAHPITVELRGTRWPDMGISGSDNYPGWNGSIVYSTYEPFGVANNPAMIAMQTADETLFSAVQIIVERMGFRSRGSRSFTIINAHHGGNLILRNGVSIMWDTAVQDWAAQDPSSMGGTAYNVVFPTISNNAVNEIGDTYMLGGYGGVLCGEHVHGTGLVSINGFAIGVGLRGNNSNVAGKPYMHGVHFDRLLLQRVGKWFLSDGADAILTVNHVSGESTDPTETGAFRFTRFIRNLDDASSHVNGEVRFRNTVFDGTDAGVSYPWTTNGGLRLIAHNLGLPPGMSEFTSYRPTASGNHTINDSVWSACHSVSLTAGTYWVDGGILTALTVSGIASTAEVQAAFYVLETATFIDGSEVRCWRSVTGAQEFQRFITTPMPAVKLTVPAGSTYTLQLAVQRVGSATWDLAVVSSQPEGRSWIHCRPQYGVRGA